MPTFNELLRASFKSKDTEEWLDVHFTRPVGLVFALLWNRLGLHPNVITIVSIFLGAAAGYMFAFSDLPHNVAGVVLLMFANFCDSTDGQMARLSGKKTLLGRVLDGFSGDVWFFCIYVAIIVRLYGQPMPGTTHAWGVWGLVLALIAGLLCHSPQASLSDYYRQIHLFFLKGKEGSELDSYRQQRDIRDSLPKSEWLARIFYYFYGNYCKSQEKRTPAFQKFFALWNRARAERPGDARLEQIRQELLDGSRPLMKYTNLLTFNLRAIVIYVTCLLGCPWAYLLFEIVVLTALYVRMHKRHETLCGRLAKELEQGAKAAE